MKKTISLIYILFMLFAPIVCWYLLIAIDNFQWDNAKIAIMGVLAVMGVLAASVMINARLTDEA